MDRASYEKYPFSEIVYAPKWYYSKEVTEDYYSMKLFYSKKENQSQIFKNHLFNLINGLRKFGEIDFSKIELITIIPRHKPESYSKTLDLLAKTLSLKLKINYEKILIRTKNTRPDGERLKDAYERYNNVKDSIKISRNLTENNALLFDDIKTTGIDILESKKKLIESGVENTSTICLGINKKELQEIETMIYYEDGKIWRTNI